MTRLQRALSLPVLGLAMLGATVPETRITATLPARLAPDAAGRLLVFVEPAATDNRSADAIDLGGADSDRVSVAARDVAGFGAGRSVTIDMRKTGFPHGFEDLPAGDYRVQVVLDRNGDYNYAGRGPGDLVSKVATVHFPLKSSPTIALDHVTPPATDQFDVADLPPRAAEQITASRTHMHDERISSRVLTRFRGTEQTVAAWVLTPPGYDPDARTTYPTVYTAGAFGTSHKLDGQTLSRVWHLMETGIIPPMIWVSLDHATPTGTTEFVDSANNGPWSSALVREVIPALEERYRMDARPSGRLLMGHSSGGWFALSTIVHHPAVFGGAWATSPDPVDFHDFLGVDLYAPGANMYRDDSGVARPFERDQGKVRTTIRQAATLEDVLGHDGGQLRSLEWTFSPRRSNGLPARMFDRRSGAVDRAVVAYWRDRYDLGHRIRTRWPALKRALDGKVHVAIGTADSYYLDGSVRRLEAAFRAVGGHADFTFVPGATHSEREIYTRAGDRTVVWKQMTDSMYAIARPGNASAR